MKTEGKNIAVQISEFKNQGVLNPTRLDLIDFYRKMYGNAGAVINTFRK